MIACEKKDVESLDADKRTVQHGAKIRRIGTAFAPKGLRDSARGFNPGKGPIKRSALKGRKLTWIDPTHKRPIFRLFRARRYRVPLPGVETPG
jgi:hypothetical protein